MALDTTEGGASAEALISVADADTYFSRRGNPSDWVDAATADKEAALRYGVEYMDSQFIWESVILDTSQSMLWPRAAYYDSEGRLIPATIPDKIKYANAEFALEWLRGNIMNNDLEGVISESVGSSSVTYSGSGSKTFSALKLNLREFGASSKSSVSEVFRA